MASNWLKTGFLLLMSTATAMAATRYQNLETAPTPSTAIETATESTYADLPMTLPHSEDELMTINAAEAKMGMETVEETEELEIITTVNQ